MARLYKCALSVLTDFKLFALVYASLFFCSCRTELQIPPLPPAPASFSSSSGKALQQNWWTEFNDSSLNTLIETALENNFSIKTAWERLNEAMAVFKREHAGLFPDLDVGGEASDRRGSDLPNNEASLYNAGLSVSYELDFWGRIRSQADAETFRIKATEAELQGAALTLTAEITLVWYELIEARNQRLILNRQINTNEQALTLLKNRYQSGRIRKADVLRQESLIKAGQEQVIIEQTRIEVLEHVLAVYLGQVAQEAEEYGKGQELPFLPAVPAVGVPADLVNRRPDVVRSWNLIAAANRDLAQAIAERYPRLTLTAALVTVAGDPAELFRDWIRSIAVNLTAPLIDGGERTAEVERREAVQRRRLNEYSQTVLLAFQEVENALVKESRQQNRIANIKEQLVLAEQTYKLLSVAYFNGDGNYLDMLEARVEAQTIQRQLLSSQLELIQNRVLLYRALAGNLDLKRAKNE